MTIFRPHFAQLARAFLLTMLPALLVPNTSPFGALFGHFSGSSPAAALGAQGPRVLFTDVEAGPVSGGLDNVGVPIAIFGKGFGATRGASRVTIGGVEVAGYPVWGANNAHNRTLDMIVVQPGPNVRSGPVVVTVDGQSSNADHSFTANSGSVYFVAPGGSDSAACSISAPCATILNVASRLMRPGDAVLVRGGTYAEGEIWIRSTAGGVAGQPKVIKNYPGEEVYLSNASRPFLVDTSYVTVSGLNFQNGKSLYVAGGSPDHRGVTFMNNTFSGTISWGAIEAHGHDQVIAGNVCDVSGSTVGTMGHCYYVKQGSNIKILYNIGGGAPGYGVHLYDERRATTDFQRIIRNVLVEGNILKSSTERSGMIIAMSDAGGYGNYIENVTIRNNIFTANNHAGLVIQGISRDLKVYNNTFYQNGRVGLQVANHSTINGVDVRNNLFYQSPNSNCLSNCTWFSEGHIQVGTAAQNVTIDNNSYHPNSPLIFGRSDASAVTGAVQFANAANLDFHVLAGSVVIDRGVLLPSVGTDYDGTPRPQGYLPDIGAYELFVSDGTAPTVRLTAPVPGSSVSGTITVTAEASDNTRVAGVQFFVDGAPIGVEATVAPYTVSWDTTKTANGTRSLTARARDTEGNQTTSSAVSVTVNNATADTTRPTIAISSPAAGATISGAITVSASANDNVGVVGVQFYLDGSPLGAEDAAAPYGVTWDTTGSANGTHTLSARTRDAAGNEAMSAAISITVSNATADTTRPTVAVTAPATGSAVSGVVTVTASATDNVGVAGVQFYLDNSPLGSEDNAAPYTAVWDTALSAVGTHSLTARARDAAGNTTTSSVVNVSVVTPNTECRLSTASWGNILIPQQSGSFVLEFDATPQAAGMDGVTGVSQGPATGYSNLAATVRFNPSGLIDARNGSVYAASTRVAYEAGRTYHFRLVLDVVRHRYSVYVTPSGGAEIVLATNLAFRTEQASVTSLSNVGFFGEVGNHNVCRVTATAAAKRRGGSRLPVSGETR